MKKLFWNLTAVISAFVLGITTSFACTDFRVIAKDGTVMIARSMEFSLDMKSNLITSPREKAFVAVAPNGKSGLSWNAKYGYVFLDGLDLGVPIDGMNEVGLSVEALMFPGEAGYQTVPKGQEAHAVSYLNFGDWVLGNFKTVEEVKANLAKIYVFEQKLPQLNNTIFPLHYSIFDASGKGIVVEYIDGKLNVHEHIGVMTNSPSYDWHVTNLRNYLNLSPTNPKPVIANGITYTATGQGAGMLGLPGDVSPPSRFVKMSVMLHTILQPKNAEEALNVSQHVMNNVDIPRGFVRVAEDLNMATDELTQWVVFKDLTHKKFYYRTYEDTTLRYIDLTKINLAKGAAVLKMPIASKQTAVDMQESLQYHP